MLELTHTTRRLRLAPRKVRVVIDKIRHMPAQKALDVLPFVNRGAAPQIAKSVKAAIMAAKDANMNPDTLVIQRAWCDEGSSLKRGIMYSRGRSAVMMKKYSHITLVLTGEPAVKGKRSAKKTEEKAELAEETPATNSATQETNETSSK